MHRYPAFLILTLTALCLALAGCNEPTAPPLDNAPAAANAPVASGTGDTPGTTPGTQASVDANTPGAAGGNAPASGSEAPSGNRPRVQMVTSMGTIELELNPEKAPITTQNFLGRKRPAPPSRTKARTA